MVIFEPGLYALNTLIRVHGRFWEFNPDAGLWYPVTGSAGSDVPLYILGSVGFTGEQMMSFVAAERARNERGW
jgi:hypothetical protein